MMIKSKTNQLIKRIRKLLNDPEFRDEQREFVIEGMKIINDALSYRFTRECPLTAIIHSPKIMVRRTGHEKHGESPHMHVDLLKAASLRKIPFIEVSDDLMVQMKSLQTDQGIIALSRYIDMPIEDMMNEKLLSGEGSRIFQEGAKNFPLFVGACGIQEPGNIGALMRTGHAGGATAMLIFENSADIYNPKAVRGSMGSILSIPFARNLAGVKVLPAFKEKGMRIFATASEGSLRYTDVDFDRPTLILFGSEGRGIPEDHMPFVDGIISIPLFGGAESLNINAAAAVIIYERIRKQLKP